jgi:mono/diheme cytochrome c family protein
LTLLVLLALGGAACGGVPGGETTTASPTTVVGTVPTEPTLTVPAEYADGDPEAGKQVFLDNGCGTCHTLSDAGTNGTVGPNLDEAQPDLALAVDLIANGKGTMPAFKGNLSDTQIADVAAYVVQATGGG